MLLHTFFFLLPLPPTTTAGGNAVAYLSVERDTTVYTHAHANLIITIL